MRFAGVGELAASLCALAMAGTVDPSCSNAIELQVGELYEQTTTYVDPTPISCMRYRYNARGVWFHYKGEGRPVTIDTCDSRTSFDTVIFVFTSCDDTSGYVDHCAMMDDDGCNHQQSQVTFVANNSQDYYIFVAGYMNETGILYLASAFQEPPDNYQCSSAHEVPEQYPHVAIGETGTALNVYDACHDQQAAGLWYNGRQVDVKNPAAAAAPAMEEPPCNEKKNRTPNSARCATSA